MRLLTRLRKIRSAFRRSVRKLRKPQGRAILVILFLFVVSSAFISPLMNDSINPAAYKPLLHIIAKGESHGNYNAFFGSPTNTTISFTDMRIDEVLAWQKSYVAEGAVSNAVGKYQIIHPTLEGLVAQLSIDPSTRFDEPTQDRLAIALIDRRGAKEFAQKQISADQFAANLAMEWAALPNIQRHDSESSYYANDGINQSHISSTEMRAAIREFEARL